MDLDLHSPGTSAAAGLYRISNLAIADAVQRFWLALQAEDEHLPDLSLPGCGEIIGRHLRVRYVRDAEDRLFGCEVIDLRRGVLWDAGLATTPSGIAGYWRAVVTASPAPPQPWLSAVAGADLVPLDVRHQPTFLALAGAYFGSDGFALAENISNRAALEDDLGYWRDLARSQARVIDQLRGQIEKPHFVHAAGTIAVDARHTQVEKRTWLLKDIGEWAAMHSDKIIILPRAISAARKSDYGEPDTVFQALDVLANEYAATKKGTMARDAALLRLDALNIEIGGSVDPSVAGANGDAYFFFWRGRRRFLDQHLKKGISRESRFTLRIYYTWDEELEVPIVGWLPSHLGNSRS